MREIKLKTHLITVNVYDEYVVKWCGRLVDVKPLLKNGLPVFVVVGARGRIELNTIDISEIETCAKSVCYPRGKAAIRTDSSRIYIIEEDGTETLMGKVFDTHITQYQQMYDKFEYIS